MENNIKVMREALNAIRRMVNEELEDLKDVSDEVRADFISIRGWCDHALAATARNCDLYPSYGDAIRAFDELEEDAEQYEDVAEWLFEDVEDDSDGE